MRNILRHCATASGMAHGSSGPNGIGNHFAGHDSRSMGGRYFCPPCLRRIFDLFDPQPGDKVWFIDGSDADYYVVSRDGEDVTVRRPGPDGAAWPTKVRCLWGLPEYKAGRAEVAR